MASSSEPEAVEQLLKKLQDTDLAADVELQTLQQLKALGRDQRNLKSIVATPSLTLLTRIGFNNDVAKVENSREALRCVANTLLLDSRARQLLVDIQGAQQAAARLESSSSDDDEFLCSRILFLLTYETNMSAAKLVQGNGLDKSIIKHVQRHATGSVSRNTINSVPTMALGETVKLLFNIVHFNPEIAASFSGLVEDLFVLLEKYKDLVYKPLDPPVKLLVNALLNLELVLAGSDQNMRARLETLLELLDRATNHCTEAALDADAPPLVALIRKFYKSLSGELQDEIKQKILPSISERHEPLGTSESLSSRLLRLSTSSLAPNLRDPISGLFFELSDSDPQKLVDNIGLGFAAGYLANHNIPLPTAVQDNSSPHGANINPVTGQFVADEAEDTGPPMTEEEKLREAERLFVLFERLRETGVVNVENPVATARREGRFEEVSDDDND